METANGASIENGISSALARRATLHKQKEREFSVNGNSDAGECPLDSPGPDVAHIKGKSFIFLTISRLQYSSHYHIIYLITLRKKRKRKHRAW